MCFTVSALWNGTSAEGGDGGGGRGLERRQARRGEEQPRVSEQLRRETNPHRAQTRADPSKPEETAGGGRQSSVLVKLTGLLTKFVLVEQKLKDDEERESENDFRALYMESGLFSVT
ncbi:hypothetical protein WMY93_008171 [Mugilogobius chulae]|uniref:Uncharacterized protein n=1 Tax=Mugilogobius chulae TaxID=88201 RepID=A0AAW0PFG2_9GOBI